MSLQMQFYYSKKRWTGEPKWNYPANKILKAFLTFFVIDEFTWFVNKASRRDETIAAINSILDYGRHDKIHLVLSIHDPKSDILRKPISVSG